MAHQDILLSRDIMSATLYHFYRSLYSIYMHFMINYSFFKKESRETYLPFVMSKQAAFHSVLVLPVFFFK